MMAALKNYFQRWDDFKGRSDRPQFWWVMLGLFILHAILGIGAWQVVAFDAWGNETVFRPAGFNALRGLAFCVLFIPTLSLQVRRLHDTGRSGWWVLLPFATFVIMIVMSGLTMLGILAQGFDFSHLIGSLWLAMMWGAFWVGANVILLVFFCERGTPGPNLYGPPPEESALGAFAGLQPPPFPGGTRTTADQPSLYLSPELPDDLVQQLDSLVAFCTNAENGPDAEMAMVWGTLQGMARGAALSFRNALQAPTAPARRAALEQAESLLVQLKSLASLRLETRGASLMASKILLQFQEGREGI